MSVVQASSGPDIQAPPERTGQNSYSDVLKRDCRIGNRPGKFICLSAPTKGGDSISVNSALPCSNWPRVFKLVVKTARERLSLITSCWEKNILRIMNATVPFLVTFLG